MANFNGAAHIAEAVRSVLRQSLCALELIVSDDGSGDDSLARAEAAAGGDPRFTIIRASSQTGPAGARNRAITVARGRWIAVVDSDDLIDEQRVERLVAAAEADRADIVADNLLTFYDGAQRDAHPHLSGALASQATWIDAASYARSNIILGGGAQLGYLKPLFLRVGRNGAVAKYDESLRIGEDSDLVQRLLITGARMRIYPETGYQYRKHAHSTSHRLSAAAIESMLAAHDRLVPGADIVLRQVLTQQRTALLNAHAFAHLIDALKARDIGRALKAGMKRPGAFWLLKDPILARLSRRV
jgi:succinoglycan biosynthesis protein ExoO